MKLTKVRITNFQSIHDSTEFDIADVTCLVGKNEAGKTALLKALYRLNPFNPFIEGEGGFDYVMDYPSQGMTDYEEDVEAGRCEHAQVVQATYTLEQADITAVTEFLGGKPRIDENGGLTVVLKKDYANELTISGLDLDAELVVSCLIQKAGLAAECESNLITQPTFDLGALTTTLAKFEQTDVVVQLSSTLERIATRGASDLVYHEVLESRIPKFLYFDEYYLMKGQDNLTTLKERYEAKMLEPSDQPLLGLIDLAGLNLDRINNITRTESLFRKLEAAANSLTQKALPYWSQNKHLRIKFEIHEGRPDDLEGMNSGINIWARVEDTKHNMTTSIGSRSRGFVWFFSFLASYSKLRRDGENLILLLDEPGLSLHAKAQADLLHYFEKELRPHHQLIYTTHSPFMVDSRHLDRVRIVQDLSIESDFDTLPAEKQGTKVVTDVLEATADSLFPLQGALGYEVYQTLFVGPNCLVVEGVSDLLYIQTISALLQKEGKSGLSTEWTVTPVGGSDKVPTFVALIGAQTNLNVAVLIDFQKKDRQIIENLYKKKLLKQNQVLTYANYVEDTEADTEADIEDMFDAEFYLPLVNKEFGVCVTVDDLPECSPRIIKRLERHFENNPLPNSQSFSHYRPARYFSENIGSLKSEDLTRLRLDRFQNAFADLNKLL